MRRRLATLRAVILNGYSIELLVARNTDGDEVSVKFFHNRSITSNPHESKYLTIE